MSRDWYLNGPSFLIRSLIALGRLVVAWQSCSPPAWAAACWPALGLAFFGLTISLVAVDWYLSLEPHYVATAFAAMIAIQQLLAALAVTAVIGTPAIDGKVAGDLGALLIATLLGVVYLEFMTFVVAWYGDLPEKAAWFLKRSGFGLDIGSDHGACGRRRAAVRNAAGAGGPPQPPRLAHRRRR